MNISYDKNQLFLGDRLNNQDIQVLGSIDSVLGSVDLNLDQ